MSSRNNDDFPEFVYIKDVLDLHGTPISIIPEMLDAFIENAIDQGYTTVRIIHGKGQSRLKHFTYQQLAKHQKVKNYYDAPPSLGGWGATIAELVANDRECP